MSETIDLPDVIEDIDVTAELERIRAETPRYPRWFVNNRASKRLFSPDGEVTCLRHVAAGALVEYFAGGAWHQIEADPRGRIDVTLSYVDAGWIREVDRAEARLLTGGNP